MQEFTDEQAAAFLIKKFKLKVIEDRYKIFFPAHSGYILQLLYPPGHINHRIKYFDSSRYEDITAEAKNAEIFPELFPAVIAALVKECHDPETKCLIIKVEPIEPAMSS